MPAQSPSSRPGVTSLKNAPFCLRHPLGGATARHPASWGRGCWPRSALRTWDKVSVPLRAQRAAKARPQATAEVADPKAFRARRDGDVFAWGRSSEGQLGSPPQEGTGTVAAPHRVAALQGAAIVDVACGATHSAFVTAGGALLGCGTGAASGGGGGQGGPSAPQPTPCELPGPLQAGGDAALVAVACGRAHTLALTAGGQLFSLGDGRQCTHIDLTCRHPATS